MAAELSDTLKEGAGENDENVSDDLSTWLQNNRLQMFEESFKRDQVILDDFLSYTEDEIKFNFLCMNLCKHHSHILF